MGGAPHDLGDPHAYNIGIPLLSDDRMIAFRGSQLRALDKATGKVLWTSMDLRKQVGVDLSHGFVTFSNHATSPCLAAIGGTPVVFSTLPSREFRGKVFAQMHLDLGGLRSTPFALGDSVYAAGYNAMHRVALPGALQDGMV